VLRLEDVVNDVASSVWATMRMHDSLRDAEVVLIVEANYDPVQSNGICYGVQEILSHLHQVSLSLCLL
jgi:hypothetical protein